MRCEQLEDRRLLAVIDNNISVGDQMRNYRLAIAATGEYTAFFGSQAAALSAITSFVADLNVLYEREFAIHFNLIPNNNLIVHANAGSDPYDDNSNLPELLNDNQTSLDALIGSTNYDIGHVFGLLSPFSGGTGLASLGVVGLAGQKARGASTFDFPTSSDFLALAAHEIGHQFSAQHTFNVSSAERAGTNAYEPASGSTLMSYAGLFGTNNLQQDPDQYFHSASFEQVQTYIGVAPGLPFSTTPIANAKPVVDGGTNFTIPARTPFQLTASGTDANAGDTLAYTWEQLDLGAEQGLPVTDNGSRPIFRSFPPAADPSRTFPRLSDLLNNINTAAIGEILPTTTRPLNFRVTVRDGHGGVDSDDVLVNVVSPPGDPFAVQTPSGTGNVWTGSATHSVAWAVGGTTGNGINTANVRILLSTDGGLTFPTVLVESTSNDGGHNVIAPNINTTQARIKVEAVGNIFFDVSNFNFTINANPAAAGFTIVESGGSTRPIEGAATDFYTIHANTAPAGTVTVAITADPQTLISTDNFNFFPALDLDFNSTATQTIHVRAINDGLNEGPHTSLITHSVIESSDATYPVGLLINSVVAQVTDDELAPVVGVDFDSTGFPAAVAPLNWTIFNKLTDPVTLSNLIRDDGIGTTFDLTLDWDPVSLSLLHSTAGALDSTKPQHVPSIRDIDGFNAASAPINVTWSNLTPNASYGVYVFGLENDPTRSFAQNVTITGANVVSFTQTLTDGILRINDEVGSSSRTLKSYEDLVTATSSGTIQVRVQPTGVGNFGYALGGLAIREIPTPVPALTVLQSGNHTEVSETGATDTFTVQLNTRPASNVVVNVSRDDSTEANVSPATLTFTPANWNSPQTVTVTGVDDALDDGDITSFITLQIDDGLSDNAYDPIDNHILAVTTLDNDEPSVPGALITLVGGLLQVSGTGASADNLIVSRVGANIRIHDPLNTLTAGTGTTQVNANTVEVPFASVTGTLTFDTGDGADSVTLDFGGGGVANNPIPAGGVNYAGGDPTGAPGDRLVLQNGPFVRASYTFTDSTSGSISLDPDGDGPLDASNITYTGLDPITSTIAADVVWLTYSNVSETITVQQSTADPARTEVLSTAGESLDFVNPTVYFQIFAGNGDDIVNLNGFGTGGGGFKAALLVNCNEGAADTINLNTSLNLGSATSTGEVNFVAETINLGGNIFTNLGSTGGGRVDLLGPVVLKSNVVINTDGPTPFDAAVIFWNTINADDAAVNDRTLTVNAGGQAVSVDGHIGNLQPLADLDVTGVVFSTMGNVTVNDGATPQTVTINGSLQYDGAGNARSIITNGAAADHGLHIIGPTGGSSALDVALTIDAGTATVRFEGSVGTVQPLADLDITAGLIRLGGPVQIIDVGGQTVTFSGPVQIDADVANVIVTVGLAGGTPDNSVTFAGTVNADAAGNNRTLTVGAATGNVTFSGAVGNLQALQSLTVTAADFNAAAIGLRTGSLSVTNTGAASAITGAITATTATLTKAGAGTLTLSGTNTYTGTTTITGGRLNINGSITSTVLVNSAGILGGTGIITGSVLGNGTVAPGASAGVLTINGDFAPSGTVEFEAASPYTSPGTNRDMIIVNGVVNLSSATLSFIGAGGTAASGQIINFIINDGIDATLEGTSPPDGSTVTIGGQQFFFFYNAFGNEVALVAPITATTTVALTSGNAVVTDIGDKADQLVLSRSGANLRVHDPANQLSAGGGATQIDPKTVEIPLANITGNIQVNTLGGSDSLTVDFAGGNPLVTNGLVYSGGNPTVAPGDKLTIANGAFTTVTHNFTNANSGSVALAGLGTISYTGLEPVDTTGSTIADLVLNLPTSADTAVLEDDGVAGNGISQIRSTNATFETFSFPHPTGSLTVNGGSGNDTISVNGFDSTGFRAALTINGDAATDTINLNAALALGSATSTGNVSFTAETINLAANIATDGDTAAGDAGSVLISGAARLLGNIAIDTNAPTADGNVSFTGTVVADDSSANNRTLNVDAGTGTVHFQSTVGIGTNAALADLDIVAGLIRLGARLGVSDIGAGVNTVTFGGPIQVESAADNTIASGNNNITFQGTINADDAVNQNRHLFVVGGTSTIWLQAAVGNLQPLSNFALQTSPAGIVRLGANITVTDGTVANFADIRGQIQLDANVVITTDGPTVDHTVILLGNVNADDAGNQDRTLTINAGTAPVALAGMVGNLQALADLDVTAGFVAASGNITVNDGPVATVSFNGDLGFDQTNAATITTNGTNDHGLTVSGRLFGDAVGQNVAVVIDAGTATVQVGSIGTGVTPDTGTSAALADLDVTAGLIRLLGNVRIDDGGGNTATFNGPVELAASVSFDLTEAAVNNSVVFFSTVNADNAAAADRTLAITTGGTASVQFTGSVGNLQPLADLDVTASVTSVLTSLTVNDGPAATVTFSGNLVGGGLPVAITTNGDNDHGLTIGGSLTCGDDFDHNLAVTIDAGTATVQLGSVGAPEPIADLDITAGLIRLLGNVRIDDQGGNTSTFNGALELAADVSFDLDAASGADNSLTFGGTVASDATPRDLTLAAGTGSITFAAAVGTAPGHLDLLTVSSAALAEFDATVRANNIALTATTVRLASAVTALTDDVSVTGNAVLDGNVVFTTGGGAGDNVSISGTINADLAANIRTLAMIAGLGNATLSGAVGSTQPLAAVTVTAAELNAGAIGLTAAGALSVTNTGPSSSIGGAITGANATLAKAGPGTLTLSGTNTYTGATTVTAGRLNVNGSITSNVTVTGPGILGGNGTITGSVAGTGTVAPGTSPGVLTINGDFTPGGLVELEAAAPYNTAGTHFDRLVVNGAVNLAAATLSFIGVGGAATPGQVVTFIANDLGDSTTPGTSPANGAIVTLGGQQFSLQYNGGDGNDVVLVALTPGFTIVQSGGTTSVTEAGSSDTFTVVLTAQPLSSVVLSVTSGDLGEATAAPATLTFTTANWNVAQTVTVTGVNDAVDDGDQVTTVTVAVVDGSSDDAFDGVADQGVSVTTTDDDTAGITVSPTTGLATSEAGGTAGFTVVLTSEPTADVTIGISSSDTTEGTVAPASLVFTAANWNVAQTVTVTGVDDAVDDGDIGYTIVTAAAVSADAKYNNLNAADVGVTNTDNDGAGFTIVQSGGTTSVTEAGSSDTFTVVLTAQPLSSVVLSVTSGDLGEATAAPATLTFTTANWNVAQTVTVTGVNDAVDDGDQVTTVTVAVVDGSSDDAFDGVADQGVSVTTTDDDTAGITVSPTTGLATSEAGGTAGFTVVLTSEPTADVTIGISSSDTTEGTVAPASLVFTAANWNVAQTVTVTGVDDAVDDGDIGYTIVTAAAVSADAKYNNLNAADVGVTNTDNDGAGFTIVQSGGTTSVTEAGSSDTFTVVLTAQPLSSVVLSVTSGDLGEATAAPATLTFTTANWNVAQTVTVTGVNDAVDDGDQVTTVTVAVVDGSSDDAFDGVADQGVSVTTTDDDTAGITVSPTTGLATSEAGGTAGFTVVLTSEPTADVTIGISSNDTTEGTAAPASLVFTAANWNVAQTVTVTGVDDAVDDGDIGYTIVTAAAVSADAKYNNLNAADVGVTNTDNDGAGFTIVQSGGTTSVTEAGSSDTFTVVLTAQPLSSVVLSVTSGDLSEATAAPATLTFTTANWNVAQTVTVTGVNDAVDDGDQVTTVTVAVVDGSSDDAFDGVADQGVSVTTTDDDTAGITVSPTTGLATSEAGGTAGFTVVLTSEPTADVTIGISSSDTTEGTVAPASLVFTAANWNVAQTVTVTGVDDAVDDGDIGYTIVTAAAVSADAKYNNLNAADVGVTNSDNDGAGFTIVQSGGTTSVTEAGSSDTFTVVLTAQPLSSVVLSVTSGDLSEATAAPATLTFTTANWNVAQTVTVTGVNDAVDDGDQVTTVTVAVVDGSSDDAFDGVADQGVSVTTTDDDTAGITVSPTTGLATSEAGGTAGFTVVLTSEPTADVTIGISSSDTTEGTVAPASLVFTAANWNVAQTVTVTGVDDAVDDGDIGYTIVTAAAVSADAKYNNLNAADVGVTNTDNDGAGFTIVQSGGTTSVTEAGSSDTFTVVLTAQPLSSVVLSVTSGDLGEATAAPATLTFTTANWNVAQTVTVTGVNDAVDDGDQVTTVTVAVVDGSSDDAFDGVADQGVSVTTTDDDTAGITVSPTTGLATSEAGGTAGFTVVLTSEPTADVTIGISSSDTTEGTVAPASLVFTAANWNVAQTVTVTGVDDAVDDGDIGYTIVTAAAVSADAKYNNLNAADVGVTNSDNDGAGFTIVQSGGTTSVTEAGSSDTFTVVLTAQPLSSVVLSVTSGDLGEATAAPATLTFTTANWNVAQTVTVTGVNDAVDDGDQVTTVTVAVVDGSSDDAFDGVADQGVSVTTTDDDTAGITVSPTTGLATSEAGGTAGFTVVLTSEPTADVTIGISSSDTTEGTVAPASLVFTAANWNVAQTVTVTGVDDAVDDGDIGYTIVTAAAVSADAKYNNLNAADVGVTNSDNDGAGFTIVQSGGTTSVTEAGSSDTFTVVLTAQPLSSVVLSVTSGDLGEATAAPATLTFTTANWNVAQTVTVTGVNDAVDDGDQVTTVTVAVVDGSSDDAFDGVADQGVSVTTTDDDTAGITVSPTTGLATSEAGGTAGFTVVLTSEPTADVTIGISSNDTTEGTAAPASLVFTAANWNVAQTVTVTGVDDAVDDGDIGYTIVTAAAVSADAKYNNLNAADVGVTNTDNDGAGFTIVQSGGTTSVTEAGSSDTFTVVLTAQPLSSVVLSVTSGDLGEATAAPATLTFTTANWNVAQTVTVTGVNDAVDDGDQVTTVTVAVVDGSSDDAFDGVADQGVSVTTTDDDTAGITVSPTTGLATSEAGGTAGFTVVLTSEPTADVTIGISSNDTTEGTAAPASLVFTAANWNVAQTVTVTGVDDAVDDGDIGYTIVTAAAVSADAKYNNLNAADVGVTNTDNDGAGFTIVQSGGTTSVTEAGSSDTFTVVLTAQPLSSVVLSVTSGDLSEATAAPATLTFTTANWNVAQTVTVTGVNDAVDDGDQVTTVTVAVVDGSSDDAFDGVADQGVSVTTTDDDTAGITVSPTTGLATSEAGGTAGFTVVLTSEPTADVTIGISSSDTTEGTVAPASLVFTAANWNVAQTVTVTGVDDAVDDGDIGYTIVTAAAVSADAKYNNLNAADVGVTNTDNDGAGFTIVQSGGTTSVTEAGSSDTFTVVLTAQPLSSVVLSVTSGDLGEATAAPATLTFTTANWNVAQTVTVTGVNDAVDDGDQVTTVTVAVVDGSSDDAFDGVADQGVSVTTTDDDTAGITVSPTTGLATSEAGGTAGFTVVLTSEPTADVTIGISSSDTTEGTAAPASLVFTAANWNVAQTVTVTGVDDAVDDGDIGYTIVTAAAVSADAKYNNLNAADVGVTNSDNDGAGFTIVQSGGTTSVTEAGSSDTFTVVLTAQPLSSVVLSVTSGDLGEATAAPATLTFTTANWNVAQTVTVTGVNDAVDDGDQVTTVTVAVVDGSSDDAFDGVADQGVSVTTTDDDTAGITVSPTTGLATSEAGGTAGFTVVLTSEPTADVTIGISSNDTTEGTAAPASLVFTAANWNVAQTVTVTGVDDAVDDGDIGYTIVTAAAVSADAKYNNLNAADVGVTNTDNDGAGFTIVQSGGTTSVTEAGSSDTFTVVLTAQPLSSVVLSVTSGDLSEATAAPATLTFTTANWNVAQTVTVTGVNDAVDDGDQVTTVTVAVVDGSSDDAFDGVADQGVSVTTTDDDTAGITVSPTTGLATSEAGGTAGFTVVLTSEPTADVTIGISSSDTTEGTVAPASLVFTAANWNVAQTVTVTGVDDAVDDGDIGYTIVTAAATSADANYNNLNGADVSVSNSDNDGVGSTIVELLFGDLVVSDLRNVDDKLIVSRNGPNIRIHDDSNTLTAGVGVTQIDPNTVEVLLASIIGSLTLNTGEGNDSVTIAFFGGDPLPAAGVVFHGGPQSGSPGDRLSVVGTGAQVATYLPNGAASAALDNDGTVTVDGKAIVFTGLEPLDLIGMAVANVVFPNFNEAITLANGLTGSGDAALVVSGTSGLVPFEAVALRNNTLVQINTATSDGLDTVTIASASNAHGNTHLNLTTGAGGGDMIDIDGPIVFAGTVSLASQQIDFSGPTSQIAAGGLVTLSAGGGAITDGAIGAVNVIAPALDIPAAGTVNLETTIGTLTAVSASTVVIRDTDGLVVPSVTVNNGSIVLIGAGLFDLQNLVVNTDAAGNTIQVFTVLGGSDIIAGTITAGTGTLSDVVLFCNGSVLDDGNDATRITGNVVRMQGQDIGQPAAPARIETTANSLDLVSVNAIFGAHGIFLDELNAVTLTSVVANHGDIDLTAGGTITATLVRINTGPRDLKLTATDGDIVGGTIQQLTSLFGGTVTLNAEDNITLGPGSLVQSLGIPFAGVGGTIFLNSIDGPDAGGSTITFAGDADAQLLTATGSSVADTFNFRPDQDTADILTPISVNGNAPTVAPGDVLNLDITGLGIPTLLVGPGPNDGQYSFAAAASVTYTSIESVNTSGGAVNLIIDTKFLGFEDNVADLIFVRLDAAGTNLLVDVNGTPVFSGAAAGVNSLTVIGSLDDDTLQIDETLGGLPQFLGQTPAVNNLGIGGGIANPSHLNASADLHLTTTIGGTWDATDVTFHFNGGSGENSIDLNLISEHDTTYTSDTLDGANSGNLGTTGAGGPDFLMSFANLAPLNLSGAGGSLLVDATSTPATSRLTISDFALPGWSQVEADGGFETTRFQGYETLFVVGGDGSELIEQIHLDSIGTLTNSQLRGGNTADFLNLLVGNDVSNDTLHVHSTPSQTSVFAGGDGGDDLIRLFDEAGTVDFILAAVTVSGGPLGGLDTLTVIDRFDNTGDTVLIDENSIDGNTGFGGSPDIVYSAIDTLNVTTTAVGDTLDATFAPGSDLDTVNLSGWTGRDQFYLSTTDEQIGGPPTGIQTISLFGDFPGNPNIPDGNDIFGQSLAGVLPGTPQGLGVRLIRPSISTLINIDGGRPTAAPNPPVEDQVGDMLNLDVSALAPPVIVATLGGLPSQPGVAQSIAAPPSHRPVNFVEIEDINLDDEGILTDVEMGDLYVRGSENADSVQFLATANPNVARVRVNAYQNYFTITRRTVVYGRGGNDYIQMGNFNHPAEFYGEEGDDYLAGYLANDKLVGGFGRDRINASGGNNVVWGDRDPVEAGLEDSEANRQLIASETSGNRSDTLDADILSTLDGNDTMYGGPGPDSMTLGGGADYAYGGLGNDSIALGAGDDRGYGGDGNDTITGSGGNDLVNGGEGNDGLSGGEGLDVLIGGGGNDGLTGDNGNDLLFDGRVTYNGVSDNSQTIGDANDVAMAQLLADWATNVPGSLSGAAADDHDGTDQLRGNGGSDTFSDQGAQAEIYDFELGLDSIL